jgi:hypothetical protein
MGFHRPLDQAMNRGAIRRAPVEHHRHLSEKELAVLLWKLDEQGAHLTTIAAGNLLLLTMTRKSELLRSKWFEFDLDPAQWDIPAARMNGAGQAARSAARAARTQPQPGHEPVAAWRRTRSSRPDGLGGRPLEQPPARELERGAPRPTSRVRCAGRCPPLTRRASLSPPPAKGVSPFGLAGFLAAFASA